MVEHNDKWLHLVSIGVLMILLLHSWFMLKFLSKLSEFLLKLELGHETVQHLYKSLVATFKRQEELNRQLVDIWASRPCLMGSLVLENLRAFKFGESNGSERSENRGFDCVPRGLVGLQDNPVVDSLSSISCGVGGVVQSSTLSRISGIRNSDSDRIDGGTWSKDSSSIPSVREKEEVEDISSTTEEGV